MINKKIVVVLLSLFLFSSAFFVNSQEIKRIQERQEIKDRIKQNISNTGTTTIGTTTIIRNEKNQIIKENIRQNIEERKKIIEEKVKQMREEKKAEIESKKEEFRKKLAEIKEERKRITTQNLSERINKSNQNKTEAELKHINALELILNKVELRTKTAQEKTGKDLSSVINKINEIKAKIEEARNVVANQKSKEYVVNINTEETLGQDIRKVIQELRNDHKKIMEETIKPIREEIRKALEMLKEAVGKSDNSQEALNQ